MPFSFPASPTVGQQSTQNGRVYTWTGTAWELVATPTAIDGAAITTGTVAPARLGSGTADATTFLRGDGVFATPSASVSYATTAQAQSGLSATTVSSPQRVRDAIISWQDMFFAGATVANGATLTQWPSYPGVAMSLATTTTTNGTGVCNINTPGQQFLLSGVYSGASTSAKNWAIDQSLWIRLGRHTSAANSVFRVQLGEKATATAFAQMNGRGIGFEVRNARLWIIAHDGTTLTQFDTGIDTNGGQGNTAVPFDVLLTSSGGTVTLTFSNAGTVSTASTTGGPTTLGTNTSFLTAELTNGASATACSFFLRHPRITNQ